MRTPTIAAVLGGVLLLGGCGVTPEGNAFRVAAQETGRTVAAQSLDNAMWYMCRASPVGAVVDRFGQSDVQRQAWVDLCFSGKLDLTNLEPTPVVPQ